MTSRSCSSTKRPSRPTDLQRILLVRLREIGDVVFTTPAIAALRTRFPAAHLTYIVEPAAAPIVAGNPHLNDIIVAPRTRGIRGSISDIALGRRLRAQRYDLAIDFHGGPRASLLTWLSSAPMRIGYEIAGRAWMYTHRVARPRALRPRHSVENQWDLLAPLDIAAPDPVQFPMAMPLDPECAARVTDRLSRAGVSEHDRLVVIHVSAGNPFRRWPAAHFVDLIAALAEGDERRRIVVTSGPSEQDAAARVIAGARARLGSARAEQVVSCGEFSLAELRALVDRAVLYVGGDSGPLHVAATTTVPIVGLYGPTLPARSAPWRDPRYVSESVDAGDLPCRPCDQRACAPGDFRCLTKIEPAQVLAAARRALARAPGMADG
ncbi:MAG: glycosyltransferase family 9 protein [Acidobacteria bacterium]|nr:glycosyltransferase family 9 protein [Acidobacteriota bacterium]